MMVSVGASAVTNEPLWWGMLTAGEAVCVGRGYTGNL